jgi:hypothetical protein
MAGWRQLAGLVLAGWLPVAAAVTVLAFTGYALVQQTLRQGANDPQVQMAEDLAAALGSGTSPPPATETVDLGVSLRPFTMVFDQRGELIVSGVQLHGAPPALPSGVLDRARSRGQLRFTWAPEPAVRIAAVVTPAPNGGFVLAGRSLREVERRTEASLQIALLGWMGALAAALMAQAAVTMFRAWGKLGDG